MNHTSLKGGTCTGLLIQGRRNFWISRGGEQVEIQSLLKAKGSWSKICPSAHLVIIIPTALSYNYLASQSQAWLTPLSAFLVSMETFCISTGQKLNWHKIYCNFLLGRQVLVQSFSFFLQNLLLQKLAECSLFVHSTFILLRKTVNID